MFHLSHMPGFYQLVDATFIHFLEVEWKWLHKALIRHLSIVDMYLLQFDWNLRGYTEL